MKNPDSGMTDQEMMDHLEKSRMNLWLDINQSVGSNCAPLLFASIESYVVARMWQYHHQVQNLDKKRDKTDE